ncbi:putative C2H2-like zinc finger protein [Capsicum annuum]|nr:putative C2H2-like zinc finger protein [Capsicum annuum]
MGGCVALVHHSKGGLTGSSALQRLGPCSNVCELDLVFNFHKIVMLIVGTCGDVQPFTAIDKRLQFLDKTVDAGFWPSVRLATHANFKEFVLTAGLEFYPLGGDPKILAEYMVKNKGFLPSGPSEIPTQRNQMKEIIYSLLPACKEADMDTGVPFKAGAIIANPPAYGWAMVPFASYSRTELGLGFPKPNVLKKDRGIKLIFATKSLSA